MAEKLHQPKELGRSAHDRPDRQSQRPHIGNLGDGRILLLSEGSDEAVDSSLRRCSIQVDIVIANISYDIERLRWVLNARSKHEGRSALVFVYARSYIISMKRAKFGKPGNIASSLQNHV